MTADDLLKQPNPTPVEISEAESTTDDTVPIDMVPVDSAPTDTAPTDTAPTDTAPAENAPLETSTDASDFVPGDDLRARMMNQFEKWLDQMLVEEPPPRGLPEELLAHAAAQVSGESPSVETDLYTLFSALTNLTGEIRLQGRAFKQLADLLAPLAQTPTLLTQLHHAQHESIQLLQQLTTDASARDENPPVEFKQICDVMIDLYDRLARGLQTCNDGAAALSVESTNGWMRRLTGESARATTAIQSVQAIRDAAGLTLARLSAAIADWGIHRIGKAGEPFDPEKMSAVDVRTDSTSQPGTVLVVNRSGYALNGVLKATALVTVSK